MKKFQKSIFIFRRDLRLEDNTGLIKANEDSEKVITCFIFDENQIEKNDYFSEKAFRFMIESLKDLKEELAKQGGFLNFFYGNYVRIVKELLEESKAEAIFVNKDYTPFSIERDKQLEDLCKSKGVSFFSYHDYLLNEPQNYLKKNQKPYTIFTHFYTNAKNISVRKPNKNSEKNYSNFRASFHRENIIDKFESKYPENPYLKGGRKFGLEKISRAQKFSDYENKRNYAYEETTGLSPYLKFGNISIRETYWAIRESLTEFHSLIRQLYWRDFFTYIAFYFPKVFGKSFNEKYEKINWENNEEKIIKWKNGETGFPIIDAGMRELNQRGLMHNRLRMICASFLVKDLHVDWRIGEKYFAQKLADYDPAVNNGNWQWTASTGCDSQPYFRTFNPWLQQRKFDPNCRYIKKWVKELENLSPNQIHELEKNRVNGYYEKIVDHKKEIEKSKKAYLNA